MPHLSKRLGYLDFEHRQGEAPGMTPLEEQAPVQWATACAATEPEDVARWQEEDHRATDRKI